jgi:integrase
MPKSARKIDYIRLRPGSSNWTVRLQFPGGKDVVKSLGTPDRRQAEILAMPIIKKHKEALFALRPHIEMSWQSRLEPGLHVGADGGHIAATERELTHYNQNGAFLRTEPNGGPAHQLVGDPLTVRSLAEAFIDADFGTGRGERRAKATAKGADDEILETYLQHANVTGYYEREARATWALYKTLCDKPLKDASRDDGRRLVAHFEAQELKSATITKKIGWLTSAVNLAIKEGKLKFNPFSGVVPQRDDAERRLPLSDADISQCRAKLDKLSDADQLLFRVLATTGMRLSEAFQIDGEGTEGGVRFVIVGKKTDQSLRRVPMPAALLPHLPKTIKGKLFPLTAGTLKRTSDAASKRLMRFLRDDKEGCGITDSRKVIHSLRHRAKDRSRAAGCPLNVQYELFGHEEKTIAAGYGVGSPVPLLKKWIDKIGF